MEPDVIRMYSSSPPPMEDGAEDEDDDFGDFGAFSGGVPNSISFSEFETPMTFDQNQALAATSPPELLASRGVVVNGVAAASHRVGGPPERTDRRKVVSCSPERPASEPADCNGGGTEVLTNGFGTCDVQGSPPSPNSVHSSTQDRGGGADEEEFADFAAFSNEGRPCSRQEEPSSEDDIRDTNRTETNRPGSDSHCLPAEDSGEPHTHTHSEQRDVASPLQNPPAEAVCSNPSPTLNGGADNDLSPDTAGDSEKGSETETETSLGRLLSTDALEEYGDMSTTGSAPSPPPQGGAATPTDQDEDFGDFGDAGSFAGQGFGDFEQLEIQQDSKTTVTEQDEDFGDFNSQKIHPGGPEGAEFATFPVSDSFGNFSSADGGGADAGWSAFGEQQQQEEEQGESWAEFSAEASVAPPSESRGEEEEEEMEEWHEGGATAVVEETSQTDRQPASLSFRLEKLFHSSFPPTAVQLTDEEVQTLKVQLEPDQDDDRGISGHRSVSVAVWMRLQDIHEALGLRYQWGGSYCNKALLCCLGIDTRNILFTGQKKQPVIVPMYAAGLGMLEPTKEPVKPVSAVEMIASIAAPERSSCPTDTVQEALPPVQFDWSSSGLTNPLDASGGSSLLNLDFFGPVEDSGSTSSPSIPGVDPELFELTTAKLDPGGSGSRVADAFARLMSTMEKTSTSTRKPKKDENLSEEAAKVIAALPDLSFMQAKVLMFPATLTPLGSQATPD
ncbi:aftiphilin a isoform X2 [Cololabis saira]|uniref:aftiphilin a isoform X2 n=1 Tax=Cololabis saira TaxID=129043 RepID=UPI002AD480C8|nr:aftiphilin a isoform X2 [Cololabis saira]